MNGAVIVGYDETLAGERALAFATDEAALHAVPLEIVNVVSRPTETAEALADWIVGDGERTAHEAHPELSVEEYAAAGRPDEVLAGEGHGAGMLVLGDRSHRDSATLRESTVTTRVLDRATCPVLVLSPDDHGYWSRITVAVNLDGPGDELLGFAFDEAACRRAVLCVVNVSDNPTKLEPKAFDEEDNRPGVKFSAVHDGALERALAPWRARYPALKVEAQVRTGSIGEALIEATCDGDLLVVGGRRHPDGRPGMEIEPALHALLHHAECPLAVVPIG